MRLPRLHGQRGSLIVAALAAAAALFVAAQATAREFRAADTQVEDYPTVQALMRMDRLIQERTSGRHRIRIFHSRQLGEEQDTIEQTRVGAIDLNRTNIAPVADLVRQAGVLALPFLFRSTAHLEAVLDGPVGAEILAAFEPHGLVGLAFYDSGARSLYTSTRQVRSMADLRGLKIRVQPSEQMAELIRALGAEPVIMPYGQVLTGLATKLIDGAENNWPSYVTTGHFAAAPYYTLTEHTMAPEILFMSKRAWDSLPPEDQAIFKAAAKESAAYMRELWRKQEEQARRQAEADGVVILEGIDRAPFEAAVQPLYERARQDPGLAALIERIRAVR